MMHKTGAPVQVSPLPEDEAAALLFLKQTVDTKFSTEDVGMAVRPLVMKKAQIDTDKRVVRNWANTVLNKLFKRGLVKKEGKGRGTPTLWWAN